MSRTSDDRYDLPTIVLHWLIAVLILGLLLLGFVMTRPSIDPGLQFSLYQWHKSFGMLALLLAVVRLVHSVLRVRMLPVSGLSRLEHIAARATHRVLLVLTVAVPLAGWLIASVSPLEIPTFAFNVVVIPHLPVPKSDVAEAWWTTAHAVLAYSVLVLVFLHSVAAIDHQYRRRDRVLSRMFPAPRHPSETSIREWDT
jgi:Cytochrome B561